MKFLQDLCFVTGYVVVAGVMGVTCAACVTWVGDRLLKHLYTWVFILYFINHVDEFKKWRDEQRSK